MIERYQTVPIAKAWLEERKFDLWLQVELAVLAARAQYEGLDLETVERIRQGATFDVARIEVLEADLQHDLLAFVGAVKEHLQSQDRGEFHRGMTSYDTEEIPTNVRIRDSIRVVLAELAQLCKVLARQAEKYRYTLKIGVTHGQHAEPITFGLELLGWLDNFHRDMERLIEAEKAISVGRLAGAVGAYGELTPELEAVVCQEFGLAPPKHSTQILHRDRIAQVLSVLAILAGNIEHVAVNFRLMAQTEKTEVREPFGRDQRGSSRMPHKKNTIFTERLSGLPRVMRGYQLAALESIQTWGQRDISQSSVERIILPDAFHLAHYMLTKLTWVLDKMEVFPANMLRNLNFSRGCIYSGSVKDLFSGWEIPADEVYTLTQQVAFQAMESGVEYQELLRKHLVVEPLLQDPEKSAAFSACFDPWRGLEHIGKIFTRFGIPYDPAEAKASQLM